MFSSCDRCTVSVIRYGFNSKVAQVLVRYCLGWIYGHVLSQCSFVFKGLFACGSNFELSFASIKVHSVMALRLSHLTSLGMCCGLLVYSPQIHMLQP